MKKLFFAAAFAVVAVAGAFATNSKMAPNHYSLNAENPDIDCTQGTASCIVFSGQAWDKPANDGTRQLVSDEVLAQEFYNP